MIKFLLIWKFLRMTNGYKVTKTFIMVEIQDEKHLHDKIKVFKGGCKMNLRDFMLGVTTGFSCSSSLSKKLLKESPYISANQVLENIKEEFRKESPIDGSWIYMKPEDFQMVLQQSLYMRWISRILDGEMETMNLQQMPVLVSL